MPSAFACRDCGGQDDSKCGCMERQAIADNENAVDIKPLDLRTLGRVSKRNRSRVEVERLTSALNAIKGAHGALRSTMDAGDRVANGQLRADYREYMRGYMRRYRARKRAEADAAAQATSVAKAPKRRPVALSAHL